MQRRRRLLLLASVLPTFLVVVSASAAALSPLDVLLVSDGHTLKDPAATPDDRFVPRYRKAIESLDNVDVDVYHTNASGPIKGPSARKMDDYDVVVWYTLQDFEGNPSSLCSSNGVCTTFHGDASNPDSGGGDVQNITTYLQDYRGRMFVTGQRVHFKNKRTEFEQKVFEVVHGTTERELYECKPQGFWYECESVSKSEMNNVLMGEQKDPVTRDEFFRPSMDTSIEPEGQRGIFLADESSPIADDDFRWRHPKEENDRFYAVDTDGDGDLEDYTHSMVRTNKSSYKTVYAGFGFEAIESSSARRKLMNWTLHYLAGPRVDATVVQDASTTDYPEYTRQKVQVNATCMNRQIQTGTGVSAAQYFVENETNPGGNPRKNALGDGVVLDAEDGSFGESTEPVNDTEHDAVGNINNIDLSNYPEGFNQTYRVQCRDTSSQKYWGQYGTDWVILDSEHPLKPSSAYIRDRYISGENASMELDFRGVSEGYRADLVRFSCSSTGPWTDWRTYDPDPDPSTGKAPTSKTFSINVTGSGIGCLAGEGNRTVYVEGRDYANNTALESLGGSEWTGKDWVVVDRTSPVRRSIEPGNTSFITPSDLVRINATDDWSLSSGLSAPNNTFYNGTLNQTFVPNSSFDPDYSSGGSKTLVSWVFDRASNLLKNLFEFTVDVEPPTVDSISPGNDSYIATDDKITINASDDRSFSHLTVNDTSGNTTYSSADVNFDPGWTTEGQKTLKVWVNDSAGNTAFFSYDYTLDDTPPSVTGISPSNRSNILNSTLVEVNVSDSGAGNGVLVFNDGSSNTTFASGDSLDPAWTTEGSHDLTIYLNDTVDNLKSVLYRYTVDETRPDSSSNYSSPQGWNGGDQDIRLEAYDNLGLEGIYYCTYSEDQSPCTPSTFSSSNLTVTVSCSSGNTCNRTVRFRSNDTAGNLEDVNETAPVKIDEEAPAVTIDNPKEGDDEGGIVSLSTEISDAGIGVLDANYTVVNASNLSDFEKTGDLNLSNGWDAEWNSSAAVDKNGTFVFNVTASDDLGHSVEVNVTFDVDNRQPVNTIKEPVQEYLNGDFDLLIEAKRPGNEQIQNHTYFVFQSSNPSNIVNRSTATGGLGDAHNFSWTVNVNSSWTDGNFSINTTAFDTASNPESAFDRTWFVLDREDPDAEVTSPGNGSWQEGKISVGYRALDTVKNGSCSWRWRDDGGAWNGNFSLGCGTSSFSFDTADCDDDSSADCEVDVMAEDEAGNLNISRLELKVDNTPPDVSFDGPPSGTWHKTDFEVDFTASDTISPVQTCKWRNATSGWQTTDCTSNFTVDISNYCSVEGSKKCDIKLLAENAPGLTAKTGFREFSIDTSMPYVTGVVPSNYSIVNSTDELELTFRDDVSGVKVAIRNNGTRNASLSSGVSFDPGWSASGEETLTVYLNDSADNLLRKKYVYRVDVEPPSIVDSRFNVSKDPRYGDTRIFRGEPIRFLANLTDDFNVSQAKVTVNYTGTNSAENHSLTFLEGDRKDGTWKLDYSGTEQVGLYNVTRAYLYDSAGHLNSTVDGLPSFRVVNHSLTAELGGDDAVDAGHTENLNLTIELNRTASPFVRVFVPPSTASDLAEPEYTNTTRYECSFGDASCTLDYDRVNGEIAALNVSTTGSDTSLTITANVSAPAPADDTTHTWTSSLEGDREEDTTTVQTPLLNVSASYCDGATTCSIDQRQEFNLTVTVSNENTTSHTGASRDVLVNLSSSELGISRQESVGDLATGSESNATFTLNVSEAGTFSIEAEAYDSFTEEYSDTRGVDVDIVDITPPNISSPGLDETTVNVNSSVILETTSSDNVGVEAVTATFLNTTGPEENVSLSLESGDRKLGSWEFDYNSTSTPGTYNVTRIYANDSAGNTYSEFLNLSFEVSELSVDVSLNTSSPSFHSPVKVTANVTGNASAIDYVTANVSKPRGAFEAFNLSFSSSEEGYVYAGTYTNTSRSGLYDVNVTVEGGATAYNATRTFSTPFGQPGSEPLHGNGSRILVPTGTSPNVTWQVEPVQGDLEDANTSLSISNTSVIKLASGQKSFEFTGNVTYEGGAEAVGYLLEPVAKGTAELNLSVNTSRGFNYSTVTAEVDSADNTAPSITGYNETPDLANKNQGIVIEANASDLSVLKNVTVTVQHPESGSNYTETPEKMEQVDRGSYRYVFTNTSEAGHYTYTLETWDIAGNYQRNVSKSFNVTGDYTVEVNTSYSIYRKGEDVSFDVVVEDANGDSVEDFNTTLILDRSGTNTTLLTNNRTGTASYSIERSDPPSASLLASQLPLSYTVHVNVSKNGNMGSDVYDFNVTRLIDRDLNTLFQNPQQGDAVEPGSTFNVTLDVNYPRGDPVTGAVVYARCNTCPSDFKFLEHQGNGIYSENFTAPTDSDSALIRAFVDDGSGNSESQADQAAPAISIDVTTATNDTGTAGGGGGGGGGAGVLPPQLQITRLSPGLNLPSDVRSVNLSVSTSMDAACRYSRRDVGFQSATRFSSTGGGTHHSRVEVSPGNGYGYHIYCRTPDNLSASTTISFSVAQKEISSYMFRVPQEPLRIPLGGNGTAQINLYNNGTEPLTAELSAQSSCCGARFRTLRGEPVDEVEMEKGSGKVVELFVSAPLNISTGRKTVLVASTVGNSRRERTVIVEAYRGELVKRIEDIVSRSQRLLERIKLYRRSGIDTSELQRSYIELQQIIQDAREAKAADNRTGFVRNLEQAESRANAIDARLEILSFRQYVYANWWRWLLGGTGIYVVFFLITMVAIPYYRTRTELLNVQRKLENAVEARKNAEKQYFRREIDRDTFMEIMTERQDEILELRGERDSLQEELDNMLRRQLTPENFVKAPLKAFREINAWIEQMRERGETGEE